MDAVNTLKSPELSRNSFSYFVAIIHVNLNTCRSKLTVRLPPLLPALLFLLRYSVYSPGLPALRLWVHWRHSRYAVSTVPGCES